ncbi:hypothetical protein F3Y22_tig00111388pilonHSYRG00011 [Hibiscus syriacus]|uniref:Glutamine amidotransferase type-2 domain-containing protein n=1 Tax=Hibiscus syriacus TaxID=106335 RepID=A0A6A2YMD9_HIBSY|nr:hypothetical protein F3Y22_tig00111388pilonHSYRG00011 [Hibiscus syriacus]
MLCLMSFTGELVVIVTRHCLRANEAEPLYFLFQVNGEIYNHEELRKKLVNHTFRTGSDCDVIAQLYEEYGEDFVDMLDGIFSFVLLDTHDNNFMVVHDAIGVTSLYIGWGLDGILNLAFFQLQAVGTVFRLDPGIGLRLEKCGLESPPIIYLKINGLIGYPISYLICVLPEMCRIQGSVTVKEGLAPLNCPFDASFLCFLAETSPFPSLHPLLCSSRMKNTAVGLDEPRTRPPYAASPPPLVGDVRRSSAAKVKKILLLPLRRRTRTVGEACVARSPRLDGFAALMSEKLLGFPLQLGQRMGRGREDQSHE